MSPEAALEGAIVKLDVDQKSAVKEVCSGKGNLRICASAGSGKTFTLCTSLGALVQVQSVDPSQIIATTFTAKAGKEMRERVSPLLSADTMAQMRIGTFHSLAIKSLQKTDDSDAWKLTRCVDIDGREQGIPSSGQLWSEVLGWKPITGLGGAKGLDIDLQSKGLSLRDYSLAIGKLRACGIEHNSKEAFQATKDTKIPLLHTAWGLYGDAKEQLGAWDFEDVLVEWHRRLGESGSERAQYVLIDEAQDDSKLQLEIGIRLASAGGRLILVGDSRQSIYGFRAAYPEMFIEADKRLDAQTLSLRFNYRSGQKIVALGNTVAKGKSWSVGAEAEAARPEEGSIILLDGGPDPLSEADAVAIRIEAEIGGKTGIPSDFAILTRTNALLGCFEASLVKRRIPCQVLGGTPFFARKEVLDYLSYAILTFADSTPALGRIVNRPKRFLGAAFTSMVEQTIGSVPGGIIGAVRKAGYAQKTGNQRQSAKMLAVLIEHLRSMPWPEAAEQIAEVLCPKIAEEDDQLAEGDDDRSLLYVAAGKVAATFPTAKDFVQFAIECEQTVGKLSPEVQKGDKPVAKVTLSTVHRAKGLEWKRLFVSMSAGVFPHMGKKSAGKTFEEAEKAQSSRLAEEERLAFVAITRAKDELTISWSDTNLYGAPSGPSSFLYAFGLDKISSGSKLPMASTAAVKEAFVTSPVAFPVKKPAPIEALAASPADWSSYLGLLAGVAAELHPGHSGPVEVTPLDFKELFNPSDANIYPIEFTTSKGQRVVDLPLPMKNTLIRVYTSISTSAEKAPGVGEDSIRVVVILRAENGTKPLLPKQPWVQRIGSWRTNLVARISEMSAEALALPACPACQSPMRIRKGHHGDFWGCTGYPNCNATRKLGLE